MLLAHNVVSAQVDNRLAVGVSGGIVGAPDEHVDGHARLGPLVRIGTGEDGWAGKIGFNWYAADIQEDISETHRAFGRLRIRPFMFGYGYTRGFGRLSLTTAMMGGFAFTSFRLDPEFADDYRAALGVTDLDDDPSHPFVLKPEASVWFDLSRTFGLNVNTGYMIARPTVTLRSEALEDRRSINADAFMLNIGLVYSIF